MGDSCKYPRNWKKVSRTIRRIAGYRCEWCHAPAGAPAPYGGQIVLSVHHLGAPYAGGRPGDPHDKDDLRRENLVALCEACHWLADWPLQAQQQRQRCQRQRRARKKRRRALVVWVEEKETASIG